MTSPVIGSGLICAAMLALGFGIMPLGGAVSGICELMAIASGVVFFGLLDGE